MELKFEEIESQNSQEKYVNYWNNNQSQNENRSHTENSSQNSSQNNSQKKTKISYDDILSSLNMVVQNGVLKFAKPLENQNQNQNQNKNVIEEPKIPMTKEEYKKMLIQDYINRQQAQRRISQIKSKKLLFDTRNISISPNQMPRDMNKLFATFRKN